MSNLDTTKEPHCTASAVLLVILYHFAQYDIIYNATTPILVQTGGVFCECIFIIFNFCLGKYSCLLYLQMAGQKGLSGSQPKV